MMHGQEVQVGNKVGTICGIEFITKRIWVQYEDGRRELHDKRDVTFPTIDDSRKKTNGRTS